MKLLTPSEPSTKPSSNGDKIVDKIVEITLLEAIFFNDIAGEHLR